MKSLIFRVATVAGSLSLLAGGGTAWAAEHQATKETTAKSSQVMVQEISVAKFGKILVDQKGFALYYDVLDKPPHFACTGACLVVWPPLDLSKGQVKAVAGKGVTGLGVVKGEMGKQVTWHGHPLYTFERDSKHTVRGNGVKQDGTWFVVKMTKATTSTSSGSSGSSSSWA